MKQKILTLAKYAILMDRIRLWSSGVKLNDFEVKSMKAVELNRYI